MIKRLLIPFALSALVSACSTSHDQDASALQAPNAQQAQDMVNTQRNQRQLQTLVEQYTKQFLRYEPLLSTAIGVPESLAGAGYNKRFTDFSAIFMR